MGPLAKALTTDMEAVVAEDGPWVMEYTDASYGRIFLENQEVGERGYQSLLAHPNQRLEQLTLVAWPA